MQTMTLAAPRLEHVCDLAVRIDAPLEVGQSPFGLRRVIPITGGVVQGPRLNGHIVPGGADFQLIVSGGETAWLDARYVIETQAGDRIFVSNTALRHANLENSRRIMQGLPVAPDSVYFRCQPRFEATAPAHDWMNHVMFAGIGVRQPDGVFLSIYQF